jgi:histidinol-phosphate/aromatic aminotransferase/cobyric acid decarboxylase-like protein
MTDYCLHPESCSCSKRATGSRIVASNNAVGPAIVSHVPAALLTTPSSGGLNFGYCAANNDGEPLGMQFRRAVARVEGVSAADVYITASLLEWFERLPRALGRRNIFRMMGDFVGYGRGAADDIRLTEIPVAIEADSVDPLAVANVVRGSDKPIIFLTFPVTNPLQQKMSLDVVRAILAANSEAIIVIDNAYRGFGEVSGLASFALSNERTIYVQTASKDLLLCGARIGWFVASPLLRARTAPSVLPYAACPASLEQGHRLLQMPDVLSAMRQKQARARDILSLGSSRLGLPICTGAGPWISIKLGCQSASVVETLAIEHRIDVQMQTGSLAGWVRISATVPCQAQIIVSALDKILAPKTRTAGRWQVG